MILKQFHIENYRGINDSGDVEVSQLTVLVGKNESGKTSTLQALQKFKGATSVAYDRLKDYPRGRNLAEFGPGLPVVQALFELTEEERQRLGDLEPLLRPVREVRVGRDYAGVYSCEFPQAQPLLTNRAARAKVKSFTEQAKPTEMGPLTVLLATIPEDDLPFATPPEAVEAAREQIVTPQFAPKIVQGAALLLNSLQEAAKQATGWRGASRLVESWLPVFIYFDEYQTLSGRLDIPTFLARKANHTMTPEDQTMDTLVSLAGLDLNELQRLDQQADKTERTLLTNRASLAITGEVAKYWTQREYQTEFRADGPTLSIWVRDNVDQALVALDERSRGFRWFFSFYVIFRAQSAEQFKGAVLMLDEPGLHLHAKAQEDLIGVLWRLADSNQVIYTTHSPFMIDMEALDSIRTCTETPDGIKIANHPWSTDSDARFPVQAALGYSLSQSLSVGTENLLVEGPSDFWILASLRSMFIAAHKRSFDRRVRITQCAGASKVAGMAALLSGQNLGVIALVDADTAGREAQQDVIKNKILQEQCVLTTMAAFEKLPGRSEAELEDLFPDDFYLGYVNRAYSKELGHAPLTVPLLSQRPRLCSRVEEALGKRGIAFHKTRVARLMMQDFLDQSPNSLPTETVENFERLFGALEAARGKLTNSLAS